MQVYAELKERDIRYSPMNAATWSEQQEGKITCDGKPPRYYQGSYKTITAAYKQIPVIRTRYGNNLYRIYMDNSDTVNALINGTTEETIYINT